MGVENLSIPYKVLKKGFIRRKKTWTLIPPKQKFLVQMNPAAIIPHRFIRSHHKLSENCITSAFESTLSKKSPFNILFALFIPQYLTFKAPAF